MNAPPLLPDDACLARFSAAIFKHANPRGFVSLRAFLDRKAQKGDKALFIDPISLGDPQFLAVVAERARQAATCMSRLFFVLPL